MLIYFPVKDFKIQLANDISVKILNIPTVIKFNEREWVIDFLVKNIDLIILKRFLKFVVNYVTHIAYGTRILFGIIKHNILFNIISLIYVTIRGKLI